ncbi:MAG: hypothetical protein ACI4C7_09625, partial [Clostridia bacterium]
MSDKDNINNEILSDEENASPEASIQSDDEAAANASDNDTASSDTPENIDDSDELSDDSSENDDFSDEDDFGADIDLPLPTEEELENIADVDLPEFSQPKKQEKKLNSLKNNKFLKYLLIVLCSI